MGLKLDTPVRFVKDVGPAKARLFAKLGVHTVKDLLEYFPYDWMFGPTDAEVRQRLAEVIEWKKSRKQ